MSTISYQELGNLGIIFFEKNLQVIFFGNYLLTTRMFTQYITHTHTHIEFPVITITTYFPIAKLLGIYD